jgi:GNAT superfamily N-acetyltransferase
VRRALPKNLISRQTWLLFSRPIPPASAPSASAPLLASAETCAGLLVFQFDSALVEKYFDEPRAHLFQKFLREGYTGILLANKDEWVAYGWLATPSTPAPVHMHAKQGGRYWIFYCHTAETHRGQGHYQRLLNLLIEEAARQGDVGQEIFIDTGAGNVASHKAIVRVGFEPRGMITTLNLPRCRPFYARLCPTAPHPALPERKP